MHNHSLIHENSIIHSEDPTGALVLDTEESFQIMGLIKEIANEILVITDRHNCNLAYKYFTKIVKFLYGQLVDDSNPFTEEEEQKEIETLVAIEATKYEEDFSKIDKNDEKAAKKYKNERNSKEKSKMPFGQLEIYGVSLLNTYGWYCKLNWPYAC